MRHSPQTPLADRILHRCEPNENGCWVWRGATSGSGYGSLMYRGATLQAHRVAYEQFVGPVPDGLVIDHLCRNRRCCNPEHLEPVTHCANVLRGSGPTAANARKTHCNSGHPLSGPNLHIASSGRVCRACSRKRSAAYKARRVAGAPQ